MDKFTKKPSPLNHYSVAQHNLIYEKLIADASAWEALGDLPFHEAVDSYAKIIYAPHFLSFQENHDRVKAELHGVNLYITALLNAKSLTAQEVRESLTEAHKAKAKLETELQIYEQALTENARTLEVNATEIIYHQLS